MDTRTRVAARVADIAPFHVMEVQTAARAREAAGHGVVHMEIGEPDFPTPAPVLDAARAALDHGGIYYTSALGLPALREAIARHYRDHYGVQVAPERVIVTAGSSAALLLVMALLVDRDEQVLMADPGYPCNRTFVRTLEGEPVGIPVGADTRYQITADHVARHWTPRTRAVLVASPSNPTGTTVPRDELGRIARAVAERGGSLVVDEIYLGLSYDLPPGGRPASALGLSDDLFVLSSFSKYFNMTGWRLGWIVAPQRHVRDLEKLAQNLYISPPTLSQQAALACFEPATIALLEARREAFRERRDLLVPALRELGFGIPVTPTGGFFVYADVSRFSGDSVAFCRDALEHAGVAITPGIDFGAHRAKRHVRFAYTIAHGKIEDGIARLAAYLPGSEPMRAAKRDGMGSDPGSGLRRRLRAALASLAFAALGGCGSEYYWQSASGQLDLVARAKPLDDVIASTGDARLKDKLERARVMRRFATAELGLPDNGSYRRYADLGRAYVVWNVFAAPELSLEAHEWCFPVAGCVAYRGYFREADARAEAASLAKQGYDVHVGGVPAYSTLGWFDDPLLSSFIRYPDVELARLIFHELAHQRVYVPGDSTFNESFATAVEEAGLARWIASRPAPEAARLAGERDRSDRLRGEFRRLVRDARETLSVAYASGATPEDKRQVKRETFEAMRAAYALARAGNPSLDGFGRWFDGEDGRGPNNATIASVGLYTDALPAFRALLAKEGGDLPAFYGRVRELAALPRPSRDEALAALAPPPPGRQAKGP